VPVSLIKKDSNKFFSVSGNEQQEYRFAEELQREEILSKTKLNPKKCRTCLAIPELSNINILSTKDLRFLPSKPVGCSPRLTICEAK
jgi:hypothetical protein